MVVRIGLENLPGNVGLLQVTFTHPSPGRLGARSGILLSGGNSCAALNVWEGLIELLLPDLPLQLPNVNHFVSSVTSLKGDLRMLFTV